MRNSNNPLLGWLSGIAFLGGIAVAIAALAAPVGTWFGFWEFGTGFQLLFNPNGLNVTSIAPWVAGAAAIIAVLVFLLASYNKLRLALYALIGALAAGLAFAVPNGYRPAADANIPPIHDISTDTNNPPVFVAVLPLRADSPNSAVYGAGEGMTPQQLAELQRSAYPDIVSQRFNQPAAAVFTRAASAARALGWEIVAEAPNEGRIEATDTTFWFRFKDDIVIRVRSEGNETVVDARSVSRVGRSDVGKNAARLREFFAAM